MDIGLKQFCDKFEDIPIGEVFMDDDNRLYIKGARLITNYDDCVNAMCLESGCYSFFKDYDEVKWLKNAKLVINE